MPTILETFQDYETDLLEMVTEQWGIQDDINPKINKRNQLAKLLNDKTLFKEIYQSLPSKAKIALNYIQNDDGKTPAAQFMRLFGEIREMGAGARGKKRPDRNPVTISENLFYKGLIALSFFNKNNEAEEYLYIPQEFMLLLKQFQNVNLKVQTPPILATQTIKNITHASDDILDHICSLLAAIRGSISADEVSKTIPLPVRQFLIPFFQSQGIINKEGAFLNIDKLKNLLLEKRDSTFSNVCISWINNTSIDELRLLSNLSFEGKWKNDPVKTRTNLLEIISGLLADTWYSIPDFIDWMHQTHPDFQRSRGEYNLWFIKDVESEKFLNDFDFWYQVEGKLLEYFLTGPLSWMGIVELSMDEKSNVPITFKKTNWANGLIEKQPVKFETPETLEITLKANGEILIPTHTQREIRYQVARFCEWGEKLPKFYRYKISATAIRRAEAQNLTISQIKILIEKYGKKPIPHNILTAIGRWSQQESQIEIKHEVLIHTASAEILDAIQNSPAKEYVIEKLNATTAIISSKNLHRLDEELIRLGYFSGIWHDV